MIAETPVWTFRPVPPWPFDIRPGLCPDYILWPWCRLDRETGRRVWRRWYIRPSYIRGISDPHRVIIASDVFGQGCYGISLETGKLLWTSHGRGLMGVFWRMLDFIPGFNNEFSDSPLKVSEDRCVTAKGRVLDVNTGRSVGRVDNEELEQLSRTPWPISDRYPVSDDGYRLTTHQSQPDGTWVYNFRDRKISLLDPADNIVWTFRLDNLETIGLHSVTGGSCAAPPYYYLIGSTEFNFKDDARDRRIWHVHPTTYHFVALDLWTGQVVQNFCLTPEKVRGVALLNIDDRGVLIRIDKSIQYHERVSVDTEAAAPSRRS